MDFRRAKRLQALVGAGFLSLVVATSIPVNAAPGPSSASDQNWGSTATASVIATSAPGLFRSSFGDVRVDNADDITVYVVGTDPALESWVNGRLSSGVHVTYLTVKYSLEQLNALVTQVEHDTSTLKAQGVNMAYLGPDAATSTVDVILQTPPTANSTTAGTASATVAPAGYANAAQVALNTLYGNGRLTVSSYTSTPATPLDGYCPVGCRFDDYSAFYGGDSITTSAGVGCSSGFAVRESNGTPAVLSAGHCSTGRGTEEFVNCEYGQNNCSVSCPGSYPSYCPVRELGTTGTYQPPSTGWDFEAIDMPSGLTSTNEVYGGSPTSHDPPIYTVNGQVLEASGACCLTVDGATVGETIHDVVFSDDWSAFYDGYWVNSLGVTYNRADPGDPMCGPGDSGGPVYEHESNYSDVLANGTLVANSPGFPIGGGTTVWACLFQELYESLGGDGLTLVT